MAAAKKGDGDDGQGHDTSGKASAFALRVQGRFCFAAKDLRS